MVSLCLLSYKRPERLRTCIETLKGSTAFPYELIVNSDGGDDDSNATYLASLHRTGQISKLILNGGKNRGVGRAFQNCLGVAEGDYIAKLDTDLEFKPGWLEQAVKVLESNPDIGCLGLFDYNKWDPNDERFKPENNVTEKRGEVAIVRDFVSCGYIFRAKDKYLIEPVQDDGNHLNFVKLGMIDVVGNVAFGVNKSVYVSGTEDHPRKTETYNQPLVFN